MLSKNDEAFGQMAVQANYISKAELKEALDELAKREAKSQRTTLDHVLVDLGMMLAVQVETIQAKQKRRIIFCPACGMKLNVFQFKAGQRIKCTHCQKSLMVPQPGKDPTLAPSGEFPAAKAAPAKSVPKTRPSGEDETILEESDLILIDEPEPTPSGSDDPTRVEPKKGPKRQSPSKTPTRPSIKKPPSKGR